MVLAFDSTSRWSEEFNVGTVRLEVHASGVHYICGTIIALTVENESGEAEKREDVPIDAGCGYASVVSAGRRLSAHTALAPPQLLSSAAARRRPRRLSSCHACSDGAQVHGDFDGDCKLDTNDALALQKFVQASSMSAWKAWLRGDGPQVPDPLSSLACEWVRKLSLIHI